jgi:hypothetical protein
MDIIDQIGFCLSWVAVPAIAFFVLRRRAARGSRPEPERLIVTTDTSPILEKRSARGHAWEPNDRPW